MAAVLWTGNDESDWLDAVYDHYVSKSGVLLPVLESVIEAVVDEEDITKSVDTSAWEYMLADIYMDVVSGTWSDDGFGVSKAVTPAPTFATASVATSSAVPPPEPVPEYPPPPLDVLIEAEEFAEQSAARLIAGVTAPTRAAVNLIVRRTFANNNKKGGDDDSVKSAARKIAAVVGLSQRDTNAVDNYKATLAQKGLRLGDISRLSKAYSKKLRQARANVIARTEIQTAISAARQAVWKHEVSKGNIPKDAQRKWVTHKDERLCPVCRPMHGRKVPVVGGIYKSARGPQKSVSWPPMHPNCRCLEVLVTSSGRIIKHLPGIHDQQSHAGNWLGIGIMAGNFHRAGARHAGSKSPIVHHPGTGRVDRDKMTNRKLVPATPAMRAKVNTWGVPIPPAYTDVYVATDKENYIRAYGKNAAGKYMPIYTKEYRASQDAKKFKRVARWRKIGAPAVDAWLESDWKDPEAGALILSRRLAFRPGSEEAAERAAPNSRTYGSVTLEARHVKFNPSGSVTFTFVGKKKVKQVHTTSDPLVVKATKYHLGNKTGSDRLFDVTEGDVTAWYQDALPETDDGFILYDMRTAFATGLAIEIINRRKRPPDLSTNKKIRDAKTAVATEVSKRLGNKPAEALKSYIDPNVWAKWGL
jgi:DNA topoisomerase-1